MPKLLFAVIIIFTISADGQVVVRKFYNKNGEPADSVKSYYYKEGKKGRLIDLSHPGWSKVNDSLKSSVDTVISYYSITGKIKAREIYYEGRLNGAFTSFHENGRISQKGIYTNDRRVGYFMTWYPLGMPHQTLQYSEKEERDWPAWPPIINYWDSLGKQLITNGFGFCRCYGVGGEAKWREEGRINNGLKDSVWTGYLGDTLLLRENYRKGDFLGGVRYTQGMEVSYKNFEEQPEFPGGMDGMMKFIMKTMKYPADARRAGTVGRVMVAYVVDSDGAIVDAKVDKGVSESLDKEAVRVVNLMPKWKPGLIRGVPVRVRFVIPVNFRGGQ